MASSFQKNRGESKARRVPGAKISLHNTETVLSWGIPTIDHILGGGLPVGGLLLVEEDACATYSKQLLKYFVAEGIELKHAIYFACGENGSLKWLQELPRAVHSTSQTGVQSSSEGDGDLKIAFRYDHLPKLQSISALEPTGQLFDFSERIEPEKLAAAQILTFEPSWDNVNRGELSAGVMSPVCMSLLHDISNALAVTKASDGSVQNALRVALSGLGSGAWGLPSGLPAFLHALKCLVREEPATVIATVPSHLAQHQPCVALRCRKAADIVLKLESFTDSERGANTLFRNYHGLLHFAKITRMTSQSFQMPGCDFLFHQRSKKFLIEKLHLPPDISASSDEQYEETASGVTCTGSKKLSF